MKWNRLAPRKIIGVAASGVIRTSGLETATGGFSLENLMLAGCDDDERMRVEGGRIRCRWARGEAVAVALRAG